MDAVERGRGGGAGSPLDLDRVARVRSGGISGEDAARLSAVLSLLGDPVRVRLLYALDLVDELCVGDLALALGVSEDAVGYGLRLLRTAGLVQTRRDGRVVFYRLVDRFPEPFLEHCLRQLIALSRVATGVG
jgi:DNA-binding transcriptional ArsR family regulator